MYLLFVSIIAKASRPDKIEKNANFMFEPKKIYYATKQVDSL